MFLVVIVHVAHPSKSVDHTSLVMIQFRDMYNSSISFESNNVFTFSSHMQLVPDLECFLVDISFTLACISLVLCFRSHSSISSHFSFHHASFRSLHICRISLSISLYFSIPLRFFLSCIFLKELRWSSRILFYSIFRWKNFLCSLHHTCFQYLQCTCHVGLRSTTSRSVSSLLSVSYWFFTYIDQDEIDLISVNISRTSPCI